MDKVKITVEQEEALNSFKNAMNEFGTNPLEYRKKYILAINEWVAINKFPLEQLALLLCGWYEVEQPVKFEVGDWFSDEGEYFKVAHIGEDLYSVKDSLFDFYKSYVNKNCEKVTEQWKITLLNLGREKPEFNKNDIIVTESEVYEAEYLSDEEIIVLFEKDLVRAFHAAENRIEVKGHDS